jgi:hypothetical protein
MKRGGYIKRKTPMTRTGINRTSNRSCSKDAGPRVVKPRARINRKSKTNSNRHVDLAMREGYATVFVYCELTERIPNMTGRRNADCVHHILWGQARRHDIVPNMIALNWAAHDWVHKHKNDGLILCLYVKLKKGELDWAELDRISGKNIRGMLSCRPPVFDWIKPYWTALIGETTT